MFSLNIVECRRCRAEKKISCKGDCPCPSDPDRQPVARHAKSGYCPEGRFALNVVRPDRWHIPPNPFPRESIYRRIWREFHRRALEFVDAESELRWLQSLLQRLTCGECRDGATAYFAEHPPDLSSPRNYFLWGVRFHNALNAKLEKPFVTAPHAARIHGCTRLLTADELALDKTPVKLLIRIKWSLGDEVILTAAIRDILATYHGEYQISLDCRFPEVFQNLEVSTTPEVPTAGVPTAGPELIHDFKIHWSQAPHRNFIDYVWQQFEETLGRPLKHGPLKPHLWFSEEEKTRGQVFGGEEIVGPYWVIAAGYKIDCTTKAVPKATWQAVVDHYRSPDGQCPPQVKCPPQVQFVQVGGSGPTHVEQHLQGTIDLTGKTSIRDLFRLIGSPYCMGVISGITGIMHIGRAFDLPLVVVAGAREDDWVARYPNSEWIRTTPSCQNCWKMRAVPYAQMQKPGARSQEPGEESKLPVIDPYPSFNKSLCVKPDGQFASCITAISPQRVVAGIDRYLAGSAIGGSAIGGSASSLPAVHNTRRGELGLCTFYDRRISHYAKETTATIERYAESREYGFIRPDKLLALRSPNWQKAELLASELIHHDWLVWVDADCLIVKPEFDLLDFLRRQPPADLYITRDCNGLNNGVMIWRNTLASHRFIRRWKDAYAKGLCDQKAMVALLDAGDHGLVVRELPKRTINAYWWQPTAWLIHFAGRKGKAQHIRAFLDDLK